MAGNVSFCLKYFVIESPVKRALLSIFTYEDIHLADLNLTIDIDIWTYREKVFISLMAEDLRNLEKIFKYNCLNYLPRYMHSQVIISYTSDV